MKPSLPPRKPRKPLPGRTQPLGRSGIKRSGKPIPKSNPARQAKAKARYAKKLAAYKKSETYRIVEQRAGGRCEYTRVVPTPSAAWPFSETEYRCVETAGLEHHHSRYARFGGSEFPTDVTVLCKAHHEYVESLKPAGNRRSRTTRET